MTSQDFFSFFFFFFSSFLSFFLSAFLFLFYFLCPVLPIYQSTQIRTRAGHSSCVWFFRLSSGIFIWFSDQISKAGALHLISMQRIATNKKQKPNQITITFFSEVVRINCCKFPNSDRIYLKTSEINVEEGRILWSNCWFLPNRKTKHDTTKTKAQPTCSTDSMAGREVVL